MSLDGPLNFLAAQSQAFDVTHPLTLRGTVSQLVFSPGPHSYLVVDVKDATGESERWVIQGNPPGALMRDGWNLKESLRLGDAVTIVTFRPRTGATVAEAIPVAAGAQVLELANRGRLLHGTQVTLSDGKTLTFGPSQ